MVLEWSFPFLLVIGLACVCLIVAMSYLLKTMKGTQRKVTVLLSVGMIMLTAEGFFIYYIFQSRGAGTTQQIPASQQTQSNLEPLVKEVHDLLSVQQSLQKEALVLRQLLEQQQDEQDRLNDVLKKLTGFDAPKIKEEILNLIEQHKQQRPLPPLDLNIDGADQGQELTEEGEEEEEAVEETIEKTHAEKNYDSWFDSVAGKLKDIANEEKDRREKKWKNSQFKYLEKGESAKLVTTTDPRYVIPQVEPSRLEAKQTVCNKVRYSTLFWPDPFTPTLTHVPG